MTDGRCKLRDVKNVSGKGQRNWKHSQMGESVILEEINSVAGVQNSRVVKLAMEG